MPHHRHTSTNRPARRRAWRSRRAAVSTLLTLLACLGLTACGSSSKSSPPSAAATSTAAATTTAASKATAPSAAASAGSTQAAAHEHAQLITFVTCMHHHQINLPFPDTNNHVNTQGIDMKSHRYRVVSVACYEGMIKKEQRERKKRPRRR